MKFKAEIDIMPLDNLLDPQGKAVSKGMDNLGLTQITNVRVGRHIRLFVDAANEKEAGEIVETACKKLLANQIMESFSFVLSEI